MDKIIFTAGQDKLIIEKTSNDWCPVSIVNSKKKWILGKDNWNIIIRKLFEGLNSYNSSKNLESHCILHVMDPHCAAFIKQENDNYVILFQGADKLKNFYKMTLSNAEKLVWLDILKKAMSNRI